MSTSIEERVRAGMALLDEKVPGWEQRIDLDTLDLSRCTRCVVGQLVGERMAPAGIVALLGRESAYDDWPADLGFSLAGEEQDGTSREDMLWDLLTDEWVRQIRARRATAEAPAGGGEAGA